MSPLIVGLSGTTNSGKTTLCKKLEDVLPNVAILNMDAYFFEEDDERHTMLPEFNYANWEIETSVDFARLTADVKSWKENAEKSELGEPVLIVEGIIIFAHRELAELCNLKYFVTLPKEECWERRRLRTYLPPEPDGYFEAICWPEYLRHREQLQDQKDIDYVDGMLSQEELLAKIHEGILSARHTGT